MKASKWKQITYPGSKQYTHSNGYYDPFGLCFSKTHTCKNQRFCACVCVWFLTGKNEGNAVLLLLENGRTKTNLVNRTEQRDWLLISFQIGWRWQVRLTFNARNEFFRFSKSNSEHEVSVNHNSWNWTLCTQKANKTNKQKKRWCKNEQKTYARTHAHALTEQEGRACIII